MSKQPTQIVTDLAIVGAGPVGLFAAFQAGMLKMDCIIIDALDVVGGQCSILYPDKPIYDIPAYPVISAGDLVSKLYEQIKPFHQKIILQHQVKDIVPNVDNGNTTYLLKLNQQKTQDITYVEAKSVIIATGGGTFIPNRPPLENIDTFEGKSVFYSVHDKRKFVGKKIVIAGGGDSAVDWAISLSDVAKQVYLIHRREKFRASPNSLDVLHCIAQSGKVEMIIPYQLSHIEGHNGILQGVFVSNIDGNNIKRLNADILLPFFGLAMQHDDVLRWGVHMTNDNKHISVDASTMSTNISGVFAIGDIADYHGKLKLILTGFAEAALACHSAYKVINPNMALHFEHSTTKGLPV